MQCLQFIDMPTAIPLSAFTNNVSMHDVVNQMNAMWSGSSGSGVIFGEGVFGDRFKAFTDMVVNRERAVVQAVSRAVQAVTMPDVFQPIESEEDLRNVPACMHIPLLSYPPLRELFEKNEIGGWGVKPEELPEDDVYARMYENGRFRSDDEEWMNDPDRGVVFRVRSGDPDLEPDELKCIHDARKFIQEWLDAQLVPGGDRLDPTDLDSTIGSLRMDTEE